MRKFKKVIAFLMCIVIFLPSITLYAADGEFDWRTKEFEFTLNGYTYVHHSDGTLDILNVDGTVNKTLSKCEAENKIKALGLDFDETGNISVPEYQYNTETKFKNFCVAALSAAGCIFPGANTAAEFIQKHTNWETNEFTYQYMTGENLPAGVTVTESGDINVDEDFINRMKAALDTYYPVPQFYDVDHQLTQKYLKIGLANGLYSHESNNVELAEKYAADIITFLNCINNRTPFSSTIFRTSTNTLFNNIPITQISTLEKVNFVWFTTCASNELQRPTFLRCYFFDLSDCAAIFIKSGELEFYNYDGLCYTPPWEVYGINLHIGAQYIWVTNKSGQAVQGGYYSIADRIQREFAYNDNDNIQLCLHKTESSVEFNTDFAFSDINFLPFQFGNSRVMPYFTDLDSLKAYCNGLSGGQGLYYTNDYQKGNLPTEITITADQLGMDMEKYTQDIIDAINEATEGITDEAERQKKIDEVLTDYLAKINGSIGDLDDTVSDVGKKTNSLLQKILDKLTDFYDKYVDVSKDLKSWEKDISKTFTDIKDYLKDIKKDVGKIKTIAEIDAIIDALNLLDENGESKSKTIINRSKTFAKLASGKFPFCTITDMGVVLQIFSRPPVTPKFEVPFPVPTGFVDGKVQFVYSGYVFDFSIFDELAVFVRGLFVVSFVMSLMKLTRKLFLDGKGLTS